MTVGELTQSLSSRELTEWRAFASQESLGEARADLRMAIICETLCNAQGVRKKNKQPFTHRDFLPFVERPRAGQQLAAKIRAGMAQLGAT